MSEVQSDPTDVEQQSPLSDLFGHLEEIRRQISYLEPAVQEGRPIRERQGEHSPQGGHHQVGPPVNTNHVGSYFGNIHQVASQGDSHQVGHQGYIQQIGPPLGTETVWGQVRGLSSAQLLHSAVSSPSVLPPVQTAKGHKTPSISRNTKYLVRPDFDPRPAPEEIRLMSQKMTDRELKTMPTVDLMALGLDPMAASSLKDAEILSLKRQVVFLERSRAEVAARAQADLRAAQIHLTHLMRVTEQLQRFGAERIKAMELECEEAVQRVKHEASVTIAGLLQENGRLRGLAQEDFRMGGHKQQGEAPQR